MTYEQVKHLKPGEFKGLCGVRPQTFAQMLEVMSSQAKLKKKAGRQAQAEPGEPTATDSRVRRGNTAPTSTLLKLGE